MPDISDSYYAWLAQVESSNNPNAKAKGSTASGLYQFIKGTWEGLGYAWKDVFNVDLQNEAIRKFTTNNANILSRAGVEVNNGSLYAAHFLGAGTAKRVLASNPATAMSKVVPKWDAVARANGFKSDMTVANFGDWLQRKTRIKPSG